MSHPIGQHKWIDNPYLDRTRKRTNEAWIEDFFDRHVALHQSTLWPDPCSQTEETLREAFSYNFELHAVTVSEAYEASKALLGQPGKSGGSPFPTEHVFMLIEIIKSMRSRAEKLAKQTAIDPAKVASISSRDCPHCGGCGIATRYRTGVPRTDPTYQLQFLCICDLGRLNRRGFDTDDCPFGDLSDYRNTHLLCKRVRWLILDRDSILTTGGKVYTGMESWKALCPDFLTLFKEIPEYLVGDDNPFRYEPLFFDRFFGHEAREEFLESTKRNFAEVF